METGGEGITPSGVIPNSRYHAAGRDTKSSSTPFSIMRRLTQTNQPSLKGENTVNEVVNAKELAKRLNVAPNTVGTWSRRGLIPSLRVSARTVRFDVAKVMEAIAANNRPAANHG